MRKNRSDPTQGDGVDKCQPAAVYAQLIANVNENPIGVQLPKKPIRVVDFPIRFVEDGVSGNTRSTARTMRVAWGDSRPL